MTDKGGLSSGRAIRRRDFWTPTKIIGVIAVLTGLVGVAAALLARGVDAAFQAQLLTLATLIALGAAAFAAPDDGDEGATRTVQVVLWMVAALVLVNVALAWIDLDHWVWRAPAYFPHTNPIGTDFRHGGYLAAQQFSNATSGWPPFTIVLSLPYLLFDPDVAYAVHVCILLALNVAALGLAVAVVRTRDGDDVALCGQASAHSGQLAPAFAAWLFVSFGFLLSIERGNFDAFAAFFAMLGLWAMIRRPGGVWLPAIAFSLAAEIKVYPVVLLLLVVWRFRWKSVLPLVAINLVLALSAGPRNVANYVDAGTRAVTTGAAWVGNSSAMSFSTWVDLLRPWHVPHLPVPLLFAIPIALLLGVAWRVWRRRDHTATVLMLCALVPVMLLLPSISHDYKVVLFAGPAVLLCGVLLRHVGRLGTAEPWWMLLALCLSLFFIARVPGQVFDYVANVQPFVWPGWLMNKYPPILLFQIVVVWMAWRLPAPELPDADVPTRVRARGSSRKGA